MSDEAGKPLGGDRREERRSDRDRERNVNPWMPSYSEIRVALLQIGVDITSPQSVEKFNKEREWTDETMQRCSRWGVILRQVSVGGLIAFLGGVFAAIFSWLSSHGITWGMR